MQRLRPEHLLVPLIEEETPEAEIELRDYLAWSLDTALLGDTLACGHDVAPASIIERLLWIVVPLVAPLES